MPDEASGEECGREEALRGEEYDDEDDEEEAEEGRVPRPMLCGLAVLSRIGTAFVRVSIVRTTGG